MEGVVLHLHRTAAWRQARQRVEEGQAVRVVDVTPSIRSPRQVGLNQVAKQGGDDASSGARSSEIRFHPAWSESHQRRAKTNEVGPFFRYRGRRSGAV